MKISFNLFGFRKVGFLREFWVVALGNGINESRSLFSIKINKGTRSYIEFMFLRFTVIGRSI